MSIELKHYIMKYLFLPRKSSTLLSVCVVLCVLIVSLILGEFFAKFQNYIWLWSVVLMMTIVIYNIEPFFEKVFSVGVSIIGTFALVSVLWLGALLYTMFPDETFGFMQQIFINAQTVCLGIFIDLLLYQ